ncbi:MAG: choice-of-anchor D domain-containing protein [Candidatus Kapaibacterium sp.]
MNINKRSILLLLLAITLFTSISYSQGIKAVFTPSARNFPSFGNVVVGKSKDQTIRIYNDSASTGILIGTVKFAKGSVFSISGSSTIGLYPGQSDTLTVHFQPDTLGLVRDTLIITHNADTSISLKNPLQYVLSGSGTLPDTFPKISVTSPGGFGTFINFGTVTVGKTLSKTLVIKNVSDTIRELIGNVGVPFTSRYSIAAGSGAYSLDTGKTITVTVNFTPDTAAQFLVDSIFVISNAAPPNNRMKITLFGSGTKPTPFPKITIGGFFGNINFRTDTIGHPPKTASFTITNTSDSVRTLTGNISAPHSPFSIVSGGGSFSLDSGKSTTVQLAFAATTIGNFTDTIFITSNSDPANPPIKIPLVGTGYTVTGSHLVVQPSTLNFGANKQYASVPSISVKIKNNGDTPQDLLTGSASSPTAPFSIVSGGGAFSLLKTDSLVITVQMASDKTGTFQDSIVINSNSNDNSKHFLVHLVGVVTAQTSVRDGEGNGLHFITAVPNPFTGKTVIGFSLDAASSVSLKIYDMLGKKIYESQERLAGAGVNQIEWNAAGIEDGTYLCVLNTGKENRSIKVLLSK